MVVTLGFLWGFRNHLIKQTNLPSLSAGWKKKRERHLSQAPIEALWSRLRHTSTLQSGWLGSNRKPIHQGPWWQAYSTHMGLVGDVGTILLMVQKSHSQPTTWNDCSKPLQKKWVNYHIKSFFYRISGCHQQYGFGISTYHLPPKSSKSWYIYHSHGSYLGNSYLWAQKTMNHWRHFEKKTLWV